VSTLAGSAGIAGSADGVGASARFNHPTGIAIDGAGNIYVADTTNNTVRKITATGAVSTIAGLPGVSGNQDGVGSDALFNSPGGLAVDGYGNVYVADTGNSTIRKVSASGVVTTIAGLPGIAGLMDGPGNNAWFNQPKGIVLSSNGTLYVADTGNAAIRAVTLGGSVTTLDLSSGDSSANNADIVPPITQTVATSSTSAPGVAASGGSNSGGGGGGMSGGTVLALLFACSLRAGLRRWRIASS
jgi:streptogramin lyase